MISTTLIKHRISYIFLNWIVVLNNILFTNKEFNNISDSKTAYWQQINNFSFENF